MSLASHFDQQLALADLQQPRSEVDAA
jgi:hypothetical protein